MNMGKQVKIYEVKRGIAGEEHLQRQQGQLNRLIATEI
jgi:hypothetical protein